MIRSFRPSTALAASILAISGAVFALSACGGDSDAEDISNTISALLISIDPTEVCTELLSANFVKEVYGDVEACKRAEEGSEDDDKPETVTVSDIEVDGDRATAVVLEQGGSTDGATGEFILVSVDGVWRVDGVGIDYLRSKLDRGFANEEDFTEEEAGPLADVKVRECLRTGLADLDDDSFRALAYDGMADREPSGPFVEILTDCMAQSGGDGEVSLLRRQFEQGIRESALAGEASEEEIECVLQKLRDTISEEDIIEQVGRGEDDVDPALARKAAQAIAQC